MIGTHRISALLVFGILVALGTNAHCEDRTDVGNRFNDEEEIISVSKWRALDYGVLWHHGCLFNQQFFGLRIGTEKSHKIKFFYGNARWLAGLKREALTAMAEIPVRDGQIHGKVRLWDENGKLLVEVPYNKGKIHGECHYFSNTGKLLGTSTLDNGNGTYRTWDPSSDDPKVSLEIEYVDGKAVSTRQAAPQKEEKQPPSAEGRAAK